jgi:hypothetical protein
VPHCLRAHTLLTPLQGRACYAGKLVKATFASSSIYDKIDVGTSVSAAILVFVILLAILALVSTAMVVKYVIKFKSSVRRTLRPQSPKIAEISVYLASWFRPIQPKYLSISLVFIASKFNY